MLDVASPNVQLALVAFVEVLLNCVAAPKHTSLALKLATGAGDTTTVFCTVALQLLLVLDVNVTT